MGRRNVSSFDDVLVDKFRCAIGTVLNRLNKSQELENVEMLWSTERRRSSFSDSSHPSLNATGQSGTSDRQKFSYTFEHFAQHLDTSQSFVQNLMELLVSETARQAILVAADSNFESTRSVSNNDHHNHPEQNCRRENYRSRALHGEIERITRRYRRAHRPSSGSPDMTRMSSPTQTRTIYTSFGEPFFSAIRAGPQQDSAATTRQARAGRSPRRDVREEVARRDLSSLRRRLEQRREEAVDRRTPREGHSAISEQGGSEASLVRRFLTQPFPSEVRISDSQPIDPNLTDNTFSMSQAPSPTLIAGSSLPLDLPDVQVEVMVGGSSGGTSPLRGSQEQVDASLLRNTAYEHELWPLNRHNEFDIFSERRRRENRGNSARNGNDEYSSALHVTPSRAANDEEEDFSLDNAQQTLTRADQTLRHIMGDGPVGQAARRFDLPFARLPSRARSVSTRNRLDASESNFLD